jgi:hypothetical protein
MARDVSAPGMTRIYANSKKAVMRFRKRSGSKIRLPRYGCPARTLRLRLLLVPQDEPFPLVQSLVPPRFPSVRGFFCRLAASHHHAVTRFGCLRKPGITARKGSGQN